MMEKREIMKYMKPELELVILGQSDVVMTSEPPIETEDDTLGA